MEPLEFCDICFQRGKTNLCETYRNTFTKISPLHFTQQTKLDRILNELEIRPRLINRQWACMLEFSKRGKFLDSLYGTNITIHTLEDHVKILTRLYKPESRDLGKLKEFEIPSLEAWEEFNPESRRWDALKVQQINKKFFAKICLGNILKHSSFEGISYFRAYLDKDLPVLAPMEKRGAYNIISTISKPISAEWKTDSTNEHIFIKIDQLANSPDEIFNILYRVGTTNKKIPEMLIFKICDYEIVKTVLALIKINLIKSSEIIITLFNKDSTNPILIEKLEKERLETMLKIITEIGGKIENENENFIITGKKGTVKLTFVDNDKSIQDGKEIQISVQAFEDPARFTEILHMIKKRLGLQDLPLETMVSQHWPIITDVDLQYVVQSAISWWPSNSILASKIIGEQNKFTKINQWFSKIKEGKIRSNLDTVTLGKIIKFKEAKQ